MYKIIIDSNILFSNEEDQLGKVFNSYISDIHNFIYSNKITGKVEICLPQLVIDERIIKRLLSIEKQYLNMNNSFKNLKEFGIVDLKEKEFKRDKYTKILNENAEKEIKKYDVRVIPTIKYDQDILIQRAMLKTAPFNSKEGSSDKGIKDTFIWLSLLDDAKKNSNCGYILLTKDGTGFDEGICKKEFEVYSSAEFKIMKSVQELKEFLDEKYKLNLTLKKIYEEVEEEIKCLSGTLTIKSKNAIKQKYQIFSGGFGSAGTLSTGVFGGGGGGGTFFSGNPQSTAFASGFGGSLSINNNFNENIDDYDFYDLEVRDISHLNDEKFNIKLELTFLMKNEQVAPGNANYVFSWSPVNRKTYNVELLYDRKEYKTDNNAIKILNISTY